MKKNCLLMFTTVLVQFLLKYMALYSYESYILIIERVNFTALPRLTLTHVEIKLFYIIRNIIR